MIRFLWVRLQLESIWRCKTKNEIQATLRDLPSDLDSLYAGCFSKIVSDIGLNSLRWTYCAPRPFKVAELCELLAIHPQTGSLQREQIVDKSAIIEDCFNLVYINVNDEVVLVHHSLRGFLQVATNSTIRPKWNLEKEKLDLGWLCLKYLTGPDFTLALEQRSKKVAVPYDGRTLVQQVLKVPRFLQQKPTHFAPPIRVNPQDFGVPKRQAPKSSYALNFARNTWLPLTRQIVVGTEQWQMFLDLALQPSEQFKFHPWDCQAESMQAHYCKLLGWSIANNHWPLLQALDKAEAPKPRTEIFDLPLPEYQNLLPLHLAARTQEKARGTSSQAHIFSYVLDHAVWQRDNRKYTALHHAAEVGNGACIQCMLHRRGKDVDLDTQDDHNRTALVIAALEGRHEIVQILLDLGADCDITYLVGDLSRFTERPLMGAVKNGRLSVVEILLQPGALTNARIDAFDSRNRTALHYAAEFPTKHSGPIVARLLLAGADRHWEDVSGRTALQVACNRGNVAAAHELVDSLIPKRANVIPLFIDAAIRRHDDTTVQTFIQAGGFDAAKHPLLRREGCRRLEQMPIKELQGYIRFLKDSGLDLNAVDVEGYTPLMRAMRMPYQKLTNVLLFFEDVERFSRSEDGNTPLHIAITKLGLDDLLVGRLFKPPMSDDCVELDISNLRGLTPLSLLLIHRDVRPLIHAERWRSVLAAGRLKTALKAIPNYRFSQDENIAHMIQQAVINLQYFLSIVTLGTLHVVFTISNRDHDLGEVERIERMFTRMGGGSRSALPRCRCESHATWESFRFDVGTIIKGAGLLVCLVPEKARLSHLEEAATSSSGPTPEAEYIRDRA
jgi:ankyrin repeat protein